LKSLFYFLDNLYYYKKISVLEWIKNPRKYTKVYVIESKKWQLDSGH